MKKIILRSSSFIDLLCFNILVSSLLFWLGELVLGNLEISGDAYFGIGYLVLVLLNVFLSYFYAKARIGEKGLDNFDNSWSSNKNIDIFSMGTEYIFRLIAWR